VLVIINCASTVQPAAASTIYVRRKYRVRFRTPVEDGTTCCSEYHLRTAQVPGTISYPGRIRYNLLQRVPFTYGASTGYDFVPRSNTVQPAAASTIYVPQVPGTISYPGQIRYNLLQRVPFTYSASTGYHFVPRSNTVQPAAASTCYGALHHKKRKDTRIALFSYSHVLYLQHL
jgi:hypothetical protein